MKACERLEISIHETACDPETVSDGFELFAAMAAERNITSFPSGSRAGFETIVEMPTAVTMAARNDGTLVGINIYVQEDDRVYAHLGAYSEFGYRTWAPSGLFLTALNFFSSRAAWLDWGGAPGAVDDPSHGISRFKDQFSNSTLPTFICGLVLQPATYLSLIHISEPTRPY